MKFPRWSPTEERCKTEQMNNTVRPRQKALKASAPMMYFESKESANRSGSIFPSQISYFSNKSFFLFKPFPTFLIACFLIKVQHETPKLISYPSIRAWRADLDFFIRLPEGMHNNKIVTVILGEIFGNMMLKRQICDKH